MCKKLERLINELKPPPVGACGQRRALRQGDYYNYEGNTYILAADHGSRWVFVDIQNGHCLGDMCFDLDQTPYSLLDITSVGGFGHVF